MTTQSQDGTCELAHRASDTGLSVLCQRRTTFSGAGTGTEHGPSKFATACHRGGCRRTTWGLSTETDGRHRQEAAAKTV
nr:hypothetical protein BaRGS_001668 [Batillaria attramentaria]